MKIIRFIVLLLILFISSIAGVYASNYVVQEIYTVSGYAGILGTSINNNGQIVGPMEKSASDSRGIYSWQKTTGIIDLTVLGRFDHGGIINDNGYIVGLGSGANGDSESIVLRNPDGTLSNITGLAGSSHDYACAINNNNQIVGVSGDNLVLLNSDKALYILDELGGMYLNGVAINNSGQIVWSCYNQITKCNCSYIWDPIDKTAKQFSNNFITADINDAGLVLGNTSDGLTAIYDSNCDLLIYQSISGSPITNAVSINNLGQAIGKIDDRYIQWDQSGNVNILPYPSDWIYSYITDLNDHGQIVGIAQTESTPIFIALWQPIPEPSSLLALSFGLLPMGLIIVRRKR